MVLVDSQIPFLLEFVRQFQPAQGFDGRTLTNQQIRDVSATTLFIRSTTTVNRELLHNTRVTHIGSATAGTDHVDVQYLQDNAINFVDAAGSNALAVANYVVSALAALQIDLSKKRLGIIGFGNVGTALYRQVYKQAERVYVYDPYIPLDIRRRNLQALDFNNMLITCSVLSLHTSYSQKGKFPSHHLINENNAPLIPKNCVVINTSRGNVISEKGLEILANKGVTLVLDVWPNEPHVLPYLVEAASIATPHVAGHTHKAKRNGAEQMMQAYCTWFNVPIPWQQAAKALHMPDVQELGKQRDLLLETNMFRDRYLREPGAATFDICRKQYPLPTVEP